MWKSHLLICFVIHSDTGMKVEWSVSQTSAIRWASPDLVKEVQALVKNTIVKQALLCYLRTIYGVLYGTINLWLCQSECDAYTASDWRRELSELRLDGSDQEKYVPSLRFPRFPK